MKIGLLAMSGIRAHDPELLELGLTLPGFVERSRQVAALPSLGLLTLAACTPAGHELVYLESSAVGECPAELFGCDLVAISTFSAQVFEAYAIADRLRAAGVRVAMGGLHVSVLPEEAREHADYVGVGEGEHVWPAIVAAAAAGAPGRVFRAEEFPPVDVRALPVPRFDLLGDRPYNRFTVQTSRGCPWRCDFCASTVMLGRPYRKRPVGDVIRDIEAVLALRPGAFIEFADDNTFVDKAWGKELCRRLAPLGIKWFTETDVSVADDPELLELMRAAGCRQLLIGIESPEASALEGMELRCDFKLRRAAGAAEAIRTIQSYGITVNGCFILGLDRHDTTVFGRVLDFAETNHLYEVQVTLLTAFPGTPLLDRLRAEGRVIEPGRWDLCTLFDVNYLPARMSPDDLRHGIRWLSQRLHAAEPERKRHEAFHDDWRSARAQRPHRNWPRRVPMVFGA